MPDTLNFDVPNDDDSSQIESRTEFDMTPPPITSVKRPASKAVAPNLDFLRPSKLPGEIGRLGGYRVLKVLGTGGMGIVFQAEDPNLKRLVALKVMKPLLAVYDNARKRFTREAQSAAAINHEHVVHIYQVGEDQGIPFLAMELLEGESLDVVLRREKCLPLAEVLRISREVASGLSAAHRRGLIHRDVKPANIMLVAVEPTVQVARAMTDGSDFVLPSSNEPAGSKSALTPTPGSASAIWLTRVKLVDFGLARAAEGDDELTQSGHIPGTPQYMSPEQVEGTDFDHRSDLFSLGCVMYRMLCGEPPFAGRSAQPLLLAITQRPHKPLREHIPDLPREVSDVIDRLLAKQPEQRYSSALELIAVLAEIERRLAAHQLQVVATSPEVVASETTALPLPSTEQSSTISITDTTRPTATHAKPDCQKIFIATVLALVVAGFAIWQGIRHWSDSVDSDDLANQPALPPFVSFSPFMTPDVEEDEPSPQDMEDALPPENVAMRERQAAEWALRIGGSVKVRFADGSLRLITASKDLPEEDFVLDTIDVSSNPRVKDSDVRRFVTGLSGLSSLQIHHTSITDAALEPLRNSTTLNNLHVEGTQVTDEGFRSLGTLPALYNLNVNLTKLTAACLSSVFAQPQLKYLNIGSIPASSSAAQTLLASPHWTQLGLHESWIHPDYMPLLMQQPDLKGIGVYGDLSVSRLRLLLSLPKLSRLNFHDQSAWSAELAASLSLFPQLDSLGLFHSKPSTGWSELAAARPWREMSFGYGIYLPDEFFDGLDRVSSLTTLQLTKTTQSRTRLQRFRADHPQVEIVSDASRWRDREVADRLLRLGGISVGVGDHTGEHRILRVEELPDTEFRLVGIHVMDCPTFDNRLLASLTDLDSLRVLHLWKSSVTERGLTALSEFPRLDWMSYLSQPLSEEGLNILSKQVTLSGLSIRSCPVDRIQYLAPLKLSQFGMEESAGDQATVLLESLAAYFPNLSQLGLGSTIPTAEDAAILLKLPKLRRLQSQISILSSPEFVSVLARHPSLITLELFGGSLAPWSNLAPLQRIERFTLGVTTLNADHIAHVAELPQLQTLNIDRTNLTSDAIEAFSQLRHVTKIRFGGCEISDSDWIKLTESVPKTELIWNDKPRLIEARK